MIVKCSHCNGKMRVDESRIPKDEKVKIRCPHCGGIGFLQDPLPPAHPKAIDTSETGSADRPQSAKTPTTDLKMAPELDEPFLPADAFKDFRFPAEEEIVPPSRQPMGTGLRILIWIIVSLGVVAFFALLVNIVLPGPSGGKAASGVLNPDRSAPASLRGTVQPQQERDLSRNPSGRQ